MGVGGDSALSKPNCMLFFGPEQPEINVYTGACSFRHGDFFTDDFPSVIGKFNYPHFKCLTLSAQQSLPIWLRRFMKQMQSSKFFTNEVRRGRKFRRHLRCQSKRLFRILLLTPPPEERLATTTSGYPTFPPVPSA